MRILLQRVTEASVRVDGEITGEIGPGLLLLVGIGTSDTATDIEQMVTRIANLRIFEDAAGKMNLSALDLLNQDPSSIGMLAVSQFTLFGDTRKGRRPSFVDAARPEQAIPLLEQFVNGLIQLGFRVEQGVFGAHMAVSLVNDGPVTIWIDSVDFGQPRRSS
jgi:D-tyrosyl-tRNA(Tyr) deacylase